MRKEPQSPSFPHSHMPPLNWRTLASHIGHSLESVIAAACNFSPCEPPQNKGCTSSATQAPCDPKKKLCAPLLLFRPTSVLVRFVCFLHSAVFTARSCRWDSTAPVSCADHIEIMRAKKKDGMRRKTFLKSSWSSFTSSSPSSIFSNLQCRHPSRGNLGHLSIRVCPKIAAKTCS